MSQHASPPSSTKLASPEKSESARTVYDEVPYPSAQHPDLHPAAVAAAARLCGAPARSAGYRLLEIGCGEGVNLMAMAQSAPDCAFIGFDLAPSAIARARTVAREAGLDNVRFEVADLTQTQGRFGRFDYVVSHGVLAWTPEPVRRALMALLADALAPQGLGVVTYNVLPGCRLREALRDALLVGVAEEPTPRRRLEVARARLVELAQVWDVEDPYRQALRREALAQLAKPAAVLFHDELGEVYEPQRLVDVVAMGEAAGLAYVCDSHPQLLEGALTPGEEGVPGDWVAHEQARDIADMRRFRRSIFTPAPATFDRRISPERWDGLWVEGDFARDAPESGGPAHRFRTRESGVIEFDDDSVAAALDAIVEARPACASVEIFTTPAARQALSRLVGAGVLRLRAAPNAAASRLPSSPRAGALALAMARLGAPIVPTLSGGSLELGDDAVRALLLLCDGGRDRAALIGEMADRLGQTPARIEADVDGVLERMRRLGVFAA
jgi:SAM-dependent methyltransferase